MLAVIDVVVRCRNEMPHARRTFEMLAAQRMPAARVLVIDDGSTDGSREAAEVAGFATIGVPGGVYVPGRALNAGMRLTTSAIVAFINADAVPLAPDALARLVQPLLADAGTIASYGRQRARPSADAITRADHAAAFGDAPPPIRFGTFFSMAASAIRRSGWLALPFDERLRYSEDVDWIRRAEALGWRIHYAPEAEFEHSHEYSLRGHLRRRIGEGTADAAIHRLGPPRLIRDLGRPLAGAILRDVRRGLVPTPERLAIRVAQAAGTFVGRRRAGRGGGWLA